MKIKGAIFDMDGVLLNSEILYQRFWLEALHYFNYPATESHVLALRSLTGKKAKAKRIELMDNFVNENGVEMKKGADILLPYLKEKGIKIALATSSPLERAKDHLSRVNLFQYFDTCVCGPMVKNSKPAPDIYLLASEKLGLKPEECIAVEDSPNGALSAINANCKTIVVPDLTPCDESIKPKLFALCDSLLDIKNYV